MTNFFSWPAEWPQDVSGDVAAIVLLSLIALAFIASPGAMRRRGDRKRTAALAQAGAAIAAATPAAPAATIVGGSSSPKAAAAPLIVPRAALDPVDREFLPAALELLETPPSPVKIWGIWLICSAVMIGLIGAWVGSLDIHAVAQGRIHPSGRSKVVQPLEAGRVVGIKIENGSKVAAGDVLLELDPTETSADKDAQVREMGSGHAEMMRRMVAIAVAKDGTYAPKPIPFTDDIDEQTRQREGQLLRAELDQLNASRASLTAQVNEQNAARNRLKSSIAAREKLIGLTKERSDTRTALNNKGALSRALVIDSLQQYETQVVALVGERGQLLETEAAISRLERKVEEVTSQFITEQTQKISDAERKLSRSEQDLIKATSKSDRTRLKAPINGTVQSLAVTSIGQVVAAGQALLTLVPNDGPIEIEALIQNQDIGFVNEGQSAVIKVEAFPFTRYGTIDGAVTKVSRDAVDEREASQIGDPTAAARAQSQGANPGRGQNLVFPATITLSRRAMLINGKEIPLSPGMAVSVEIKTGERSLIDYILSPLREVGASAGRER